MKKTILGRSGLEVSRLAVGCWQLSDSFWGQPDLPSWKNSLAAALDAGVNFLDTADAYGNGFAEEQLGAYLAESGTRDRWVIATKFFWDFTSELPGTTGPARFPHTSGKYILRACEDSLRRLRIDCIDLYQMHAWNPLTRPDEVAASISKLKEQGKIRHFGVSNLNVEQMEMLDAVVPVESLQPRYNPYHRAPEAREFPYCLLRNIGTLIYSPLERGLFGGHIKPGQAFGDHRDRSALFTPETLAKLEPAFEKLRNFATELDLTLPQLAIRWNLTHPAVSVAIIGTKKPEHITSLVKAAEADLPDAYWHAVARAIPSDLPKV